MSHAEISPEALATIYAHAVRDYPFECCGLVFGPRDGGQATRVKPCTNIQNRLHAEDPVANPRDARIAYAFEAADLFELGRSLRGAEPARIVYHSHVDVSADDGSYFSETDQAAATFEGEPSYPVEYLVVDVRSGGVRGSAQFAWDAALRRYVEVRRYLP